MLVLTYLNTFLLGGDLISLKIGSISVRLVTLTLVLGFAAYLLHERRLSYSRDQFLIYTLFGLAIILSLPQSIDPVRTIAYLFWLGFMAIIQTIYFNFEYARLGPKRFENALMQVYRFCGYALVAETLLRLTVLGGGRARLFFYEPAHTAIFLVPFLVLALARAGKRPMTWDIALALIAMLTLVSATALFAIVAALGLSFIFLRDSRSSVVLVSAGMTVLVFVASLYIGLTTYYALFIGFLTGAQDLSHALELIFHRSGTRIIRLHYAIEAYQSAPWFGIGAGAANHYTSTHGIPLQAMQYYQPEWDTLHDNPFVNPLVEMAATMGVPGIIAFLVLIARLVAAARGSGLPQIMAVAALAMFLGISLESTVLRHYIWFATSIAFVPIVQTTAYRTPPLTPTLRRKGART